MAELAGRVPVRRQFVDARYGQVHVRITESADGPHLPLVCLHMSPKSGRQYANFMAAMGTDRVVVAPDYPGYGESAAPPAEPAVTIEDYASVVFEALTELGIGQADLFGFHTGAEVATEMARQRPARIRRLILVSAPILERDELAALKQTFEPIPLDLAGTRFQRLWASVVHHRGPGMTLEMMAESFAESLRGGEAYEWGHRAAFEYVPRFAAVVASLSHRIVVLNPADDLAHATPRIAPLLTDGEVIDRPDWGHGFLDAHVDAACAVVRAALD